MEPLLELLPVIAAEGRAEAAKLLSELRNGRGSMPQCEELILPEADLRNSDPQIWKNRLWHGDNLEVMLSLLAGDMSTGLHSLKGAVDLIYIDPPYASGADYHSRVVLPPLTDGDKPAAFNQTAYNDTWEGGTAAYLRMMYVRLLLLRELLKDSGTIYVHIDWHMGHYVKLLLDDIYGRDQFRNEIIWYYPDYLQGNVTKGFPRKNDFILVYSKTNRFKFNRVKEPLKKAKMRNKVFWNKIEHKMDIVRDDQGGILYEEHTDKYCDSVWQIGQTAVTRSHSGEWLPYETQKPEELLRRVIEAGSDAGDLVLDVFAGSGTTGAAAEHLGRRWIMADQGRPAVHICKQRMIAQARAPFLHQMIGEESSDPQSVSRPQLGVNLIPTAELMVKDPILSFCADGSLDIIVEIERYIVKLPHPSIPDDKAAIVVQTYLEQDSLALIDWWSAELVRVEGGLYCGQKYAMRGKPDAGQGGSRTEQGGRVTASMRIHCKDNLPGLILRVKAADVFGYETLWTIKIT